jgi:hypothetical protein
VPSFARLKRTRPVHSRRGLSNQDQLCVELMMSDAGPQSRRGRSLVNVADQCSGCFAEVRRLVEIRAQLVFRAGAEALRRGAS